MTQRNPLDQFKRREQTPAHPQPTSAGGVKTYLAYKAVDRKQDRMDIRRVLGDSAMPKYAFLIDIRYSTDFPNKITLIYNLYTVEVIGRNLQPVLFAIAESRCDFIQEYHPNEYPQPEPDAPIITAITFSTEEKESK